MSDNPDDAASGPRSTQDDEARQLPKRFYKLATVAGSADGFGVELDGRGIKTPKRTALQVPTERLAVAIAEEWNALDDTIDPARLPLTKLANTAMDGVAGKEGEVHEDILRYIGNDLLSYRAERPDGLVDRQATTWDPVLTWFAETCGAEFKTTAGIMPIEQNLLAVAKAASPLTDLTAMELAPIHVMTTMTGSALLTIAHLQGRLSPDAVWDATHIDEDWQIEQWGVDEEAGVRSAKRREEFQSAVDFLAMVRS